MQLGVFDRGVFISHSAHDDAWAVAIRAELVRRIEALRGYQVLIDERAFIAGDLWRPLLYRWLAQADAAVLLLTKSALVSPWVSKEASILLWRRDLGSKVRVVPVLLGLRMAEVREAWPTIEINESHAVTVPAAEPDTSAVVTSIVEQLADLGDADDRMRGWVARVAGHLERAPDAYLRLGASHLGLSDHELRLEGRCLTVSYALLHTDAQGAEALLSETLPGMVESAPALLRLVIPVILPVEFAQPVLRAMNRPEGERVVVASAQYHETGPRMADRATCCDSRLAKVTPLWPDSEHAAEDVFEDLLAQLRDRAGVRPDEELLPEDVASLHGPVVVVLQHKSSGGLRLPVLRTVLKRFVPLFPMTTVVVLTARDDVATVAGEIGFPDAELAPPLPPAVERRGDMVANRLFAITRG